MLSKFLIDFIKLLLNIYLEVHFVYLIVFKVFEYGVAFQMMRVVKWNSNK